MICPNCHTKEAFDMPLRYGVVAIECAECNYQGTALVNPADSFDDNDRESYAESLDRERGRMRGRR